jgi:hypothetical protein
MTSSKARTAALVAGTLLVVGIGAVVTISVIQSVLAPRPSGQEQVRPRISPPGSGENIVSRPTPAWWT